MTKIRTVCGDIASDTLGYTSVHEHTLFRPATLTKAMLLGMPDMMKGITAYEGGADLGREQERRSHMEVVSMPQSSIGGVLTSMRMPRGNPAAKLSDLDYYTNELKAFYKAGGRALCDCSPLPTGRPLCEIAELSRRSGVKILSCAGFYTKPMIPRRLLKGGLAALRAYLENYMENGDSSSDARPGFVKCAVSVQQRDGICPEELLSVRACALTAKKYGVSLHIHTQFPVRHAMVLQLAELLRGEIGIDPDKVIFCHMDSYALGNGNPTAEICAQGYDAKFPRKLLDMGFHIGLDTWGVGKTMDLENDFGIKARRLMLQELLADGYADKITLGHDFMAKSNGVQNGGGGYTVFPAVLAHCVQTGELSAENLHKMTVENPAAFLAF